MDDTDSFGPETITISQFQPGWYRYFVRNYKEEQGDTGPLTQSAGVVQIYTERGLIRTINAPLSGEGDYWDVCSINGATGEVTVMNVLRSSAPANDGQAPDSSPPATGGQPSAGPDTALVCGWDFGNGLTSAEPNPETTYYRDGTYDVTLTVTGNDQQRSSVTQRAFIHVGSGLALNIHRAGAQVIIEWEPSQSGIRLETVTDLNAADWTPIDPNLVANTNHFSIGLPTQGNRFYRLRRVE